MIPHWLPLAILSGPLALALVVMCLPMVRSGLAHGIAVAGLAACTVLALRLAWDVVPAGVMWQGPHGVWLDPGGFQLGLGVCADPMGAVMAVIVCFLATLVLVFNSWYLHDDPMATRFVWQFCFFCSAMLGVVLSDNLLMSFFCWELVGLGSYFLIGFWYAKPAASVDPAYQRMKGRGARGVLEHVLSPAHAQLKAFVVNRVGDAGFLVGLGLFTAAAASLPSPAAEPLRWEALFAMAGDGGLPGGLFGLSPAALLTLAALGVFCGAVGKSAQFPLHTWLPDAMQGPTTASAIIHAATMVAAGVFLVARCYPLFTPEALAVVGWTGGFTCLLAAGIACVQWDLKAVLAYSTVSQLGLMMAALGAGPAAGGLSSGIGHLFTHALFKCLLFLGAAAVIHGTEGNQDLHRMGGLLRRMPFTACATLAGVLAIAGAPFFSGFVSKDAVLASCLLHAGEAGGLAWGPLVLAATGSLLTAGYMVRWWVRIFLGAPRDRHLADHAHDPWPRARAVLLAMTPFCLAALWQGWLGPVLRAPHGEAMEAAHRHATRLALGLLASGAGFSLVVFWWLPGRGVDAPGALARRFATLHAAAAELWGLDRLWDLLFVRLLGRGLGKVLAVLDFGTAARLARVEGRAAWTDAFSVDGAVDALGRLCAAVGAGGARVHAGRIGLAIGYACAAAAGIAVLALLW